MTLIYVRQLLIDLDTPIPARWNGGDCFRSAFYNALSMGFPAGEQYFISSVHRGFMTLSEIEQQRVAPEVQGFIGQEATHRRIHSLFNGHLNRHGYYNHIEQRTLKRFKAHAHCNILGHLAATAATEHLAFLFSDWTLRHDESLGGAEPRLQALWQWHCAEECEHHTTAFDIYIAAGGSYKWRIRIFRYVTLIFISDILYQTVSNLWHDCSLFKWSTWRSGSQLLFAKDGMMRGNCRMWRDYLSPHFHPSQNDISLAQQWLHDNKIQFSVKV